jgi:hypothetical protein
MGPTGKTPSSRFATEDPSRLSSGGITWKYGSSAVTFLLKPDTLTKGEKGVFRGNLPTATLNGEEDRYV